MPKRSRDRRASTIAHLAARVDRLTGARSCTSLLTVIGVLNRCPGPCPRCAGLAKDFEAAAPDRERARQKYELANPPKAAPKSHSIDNLDIDNLEDA